ncbi:transporter substrate-binding domain-containing protein [Nitratifractor sp.]
MKKIVVFLFTLLLAQSLWAQPPLKVGMELQYPPFEMTDTEGHPTGISVDLAKALGRYLGREVVIENIAWDGLIPSLKTGKIDLIISSMTITPERAKTVAFSIPYAQSNLAILSYPCSGVAGIEQLDQKGRKVAVKKGTTGHLYARKHLKNAKILVFDKENAAVLEVMQKRADGFFYDQLSIYRDWRRHPEQTIALLQPFQKQPEYWGIAMRKKDKELKKQVDAFIARAKKDGTFDTLTDKYLHDAKVNFEKLGIPFFF